MTSFVDSIFGRRAAKENPSDRMFYVKADGMGVQEFNALKDAEWGAREFKKEKSVDRVVIVDALDRRNTEGYRLIKEWRRRDDGRWHLSSKTGRVWI